MFLLALMAFLIALAAFSAALCCGICRKVLGICAQPCVDGGIEALGSHGGAGNGVYLVVNYGLSFGILGGAALHDFKY